MSKFSNSVITTVGIGLLLLGGCCSLEPVFAKVSNFANEVSDIFFDKAVKKERWIKAERARGSYTDGFDEYWVLSICNSIEAKVMLRDSFTEDNNDKLELAYEIKAKLTRPIYSNPNDNRKVEYRIGIVFKFIDEEGLVLGQKDMNWRPDYEHEKFTKTSLFHRWDDPISEDVIVKGQMSGVIGAKVAKKIARITYETSIKMEDWESFKNSLRTRGQ